MSAKDGADLIRARTAAETALRVAIDTGRTVGYRDGLAIGRKAGAVEVLRRSADATGVVIAEITQSVSADRLSELRDVVSDMRALADRIESGDVIL
jgi:hypothetical protein